VRLLKTCEVVTRWL